MNIILCGLPASGKSSIGSLLANELSYRFIDTDRWIEMAYFNKTDHFLTCNRIYAKEGERVFRSMESTQIALLEGMVDSVISLGGGALMEPNNVIGLKKLGCLIYLKGSLPFLWNRLKIRGVPTHLDTHEPESSFYQSAERRLPIYEAHSSFTIEIEGCSDREVVEMIKSALEPFQNL
jgi:shikimate kinase